MGSLALNSRANRLSIIEPVPSCCAPAVTFLGDGLELVLAVDGYEFESAEEGWDLDWLTGSARLALDAPGAAFTATTSLFWQAGELASFEEQLRSALTARTSRKGKVAKLTTLEDQVELEIEVRFGEAQISGRIEHELGGIEFGWTGTTAKRLEGSPAQLAELTRRFPSRARRARS